MIVEARVLEELPRLLFRIELKNRETVIAHLVGEKKKNFVRLLPGDRVEVELSPYDATRGRIIRKL